MAQSFVPRRAHEREREGQAQLESTRDDGQQLPPQHVAGLAVLQDLLRKPPSEVAAWALDQAHTLAQTGTNVERLPIFQLAGALNEAPMAQKQALVRSAISGFGDLPASRRVEAVRLAMQTADIVQQAEGLELQRHMANEHATVMQRLAGLERAGGRAQSVVDASPPSGHWTNETPTASAQAAIGAPPIVENFLRVVREARFNEMPKEEMTSLAQEAQSNAVRLIQPQQLLDVVSELKPEEREQLTEALVEARVVPEEQRGVLEEAVRPGGYADKLASMLKLLEAAKTYSWAFVAVPGAELFFAAVLATMPCGVPLVGWLQFDSVLALGMACAGYFTASTLAPVYEQLRADPVGAVQRWQMAPEMADLQERLQWTITGVPIDTYRLGLIGAAVCVALVLLGAVWGIVGALELLFSLFLGCSGLTLLVCFAYIGLRFGMVVGLLLLVFYILDEVQKHRSRTPMLGSSLLPMSDDAMPRDAPSRRLLG